MNFKIWLYLILWVAYTNSTCQTSTPQVEMSSKLVQINGYIAFYDKAPVDIMEDSLGNIYEIGRVFTTNTARSFARKLDPSGDEAWAQWYDGTYFFTKSNVLIEGETRLAMCTGSSGEDYRYLELDTSTGDIIRCRHADGAIEIMSLPNTHNIVCAITPSQNYFYIVGSDSSDNSKIKLNRHDLTSPESNFERSKFAEDISEFIPFAQMALNDIDVILTGAVTTTESYDSIAILSMSWADPPTLNWGIKIQNKQGDQQTIRTTTYSDYSKILTILPTDTNEVLVHIINASDAIVESKAKLSGGFTSIPQIYNAQLINDATLYIIVRNSHYGDSTLFVYDVTAFTGTAYTTSANTKFYYAISKTLSGDRIKISECDTNTKKYTLYNLHPDYNALISLFLPKDTDFTFEKITNTEYDPVTHTVTPEAVTTTTTSICSGSSDTVSSTEESLETIIMNSWSFATSHKIADDSGTFTPEYTCVESVSSGLTSLTATYSLVAGSGSVPDWVSVDSSTAEISYEAPTTIGSYSFDLRTQFNEDSNFLYDTTINIEVTSGALSGDSDGDSGGSSDGSSDGNVCLGASSKAGWGGLIAAIVTWAIISTALVWIVVAVIIKVCTGGGTKAIGIAEPVTVTASPMQPGTENVFVAETKT